MSRSGTTRKKFLSVVLSLLMVFSIMPTVTLSAYGTAANPETADLSTIDGWKTLFGDIRFMTWGGNITQDGKVWFDLQISYEQAPNRGSDRRSIVSLGSISFDLNAKEWIFDK